MKLRILSIALVMTTILSCSSDDDSSSSPGNNNSDYFPLTTANEWNYTNVSQSQGEETTSQETLMVASESNNSYSFISSAEILNRGIITGILVNGNLSKQNEQLIYNGEYILDLSTYGLESLSIPIDNLVVYDLNASAGDHLSSLSNSIEQTFNVQGQNIPLTLNYDLSTEQNEILETYAVNNTSYENVLKSSVSLVLSLDANIIVTVPLLQEQEVLISSNYYAEDIGLIYSDNQLNYNFEDLSQFGIPTMESINVNSTQSIGSYTVE